MDPSSSDLQPVYLRMRFSGVWSGFMWVVRHLHIVIRRPAFPSVMSLWWYSRAHICKSYISVNVTVSKLSYFHISSIPRELELHLQLMTAHICPLACLLISFGRFRAGGRIWASAAERESDSWPQGPRQRWLWLTGSNDAACTSSLTHAASHSPVPASPRGKEPSNANVCVCVCVCVCVWLWEQERATCGCKWHLTDRFPFPVCPSNLKNKFRTEDLMLQYVKRLSVRNRLIWNVFHLASGC